MRQILRLVVALIETRENAEDFRRPLRAEHRVGAREGGHIETRVRDAAQLRIMTKEFQFDLRRYADARVLQQRHDVIGRVAEYAVLKIDNTDPRAAGAFGEPDDVGRMKIAQRPSSRAGDDVAQDMAPKVDEARLGAGGQRGLRDMRRIPI